MLLGNTNRPWVGIAIIVMLLIALIPLFLSSSQNDASTLEDIKQGNIDVDFQQPVGMYLDTFITISLGVAVSLFLLQRRDADATDDKVLSHRIHRSTRWTIPLLWVISMVALHITTLHESVDNAPKQPIYALFRVLIG